MATGKVINKISNRLRRRSHVIQKSIGITGAQGTVLDYILVEGMERDIYQKDIEQEFGLRPSTATQILKSLEAEKLICRVADEQDGRWKRIIFTKEAEKIRSLLKQEVEDTEDLLLQGISQEEQRLFMDIAERMLKNLE